MRPFAVLALRALAPVAVAAITLTPTGASAEPLDVCARPKDRGYADGRAGAPALEAFARCPAAAERYRIGYGAGAYVRRGGRGGGPSAPIASASGESGGSGPGPRRRVAPTTPETLALTRCRQAAARSTGIAGGPFPSDCVGRPAAAQGFSQGRTLRQVQREAIASNRERARIRTRLLSPGVSAGERRLIENRLRNLDRADALRRIRDPFLR